jgi:hypothetical protein
MDMSSPQQSPGATDAASSGRASALGQFLTQAQRALLSARFAGHDHMVEVRRD